MRPSASTLRKGLLCFLLFASLFAVAYRRGVRLRELLPKQLYISSQPDPVQMRKLISSLGLRSVLNLRSEDPLRFMAERRVCEQAGVTYLGVKLPLEDWTPRPVLLQILQILDTAPRPMLIHCRRGVDRSGLVAAVGLLVAGLDLDTAWKQMPAFSRWRALHGGRPLARVLIDYGKSLEEAGQPSSAERFRKWVRRSYCPQPYRAEVELLQEMPGEPKVSGMLRLRVRVGNRSDSPWIFSEDHLSLGLRLSPCQGDARAPSAETPSDRRLIDCGRSRPGVEKLQPGRQLEWTAGFRLPETPGCYRAQLDLVAEHRHWFSEMGWPGPRRRLEIR